MSRTQPRRSIRQGHRNLAPAPGGLLQFRPGTGTNRVIDPVA